MRQRTSWRPSGSDLVLPGQGAGVHSWETQILVCRVAQPKIQNKKIEAFLVHRKQEKYGQMARCAPKKSQMGNVARRAGTEGWKTAGEGLTCGL